MDGTKNKEIKEIMKLKFAKVKRVKSKSKSALKRQADKLFSERVRSRGYCQLKGLDKIKCTDSQQCMHIIGRANHRLRWDYCYILF